MRVLVVNAGSSSVKVSVVDGDRRVAGADLASPEGSTDWRAVGELVESTRPFDAVGHRVVHGGVRFAGAVVVDDKVREELAALVDLAPLHQPASLAGIDLSSRLLPGVPAVACFDTAFHSGLPPAAATYALPEEWRRRWPLRRFGFHGLSHAWAAARAAGLTGRPAGSLRVVTCHLGAGASLAAVHAGRSVDTTMGFTPLDGLVMATRSGGLDPGLVLWLQQHAGIPPAELERVLEHRSGLLGLSGFSDMRAVLEAEAGGDLAAGLAVEVYLHRLRAGIAAMAAAMGGLDVLVFTGGVGERSAPIRMRAAAGLGFLGVGIDETANAAARPDTEITSAGAGVRTLVVEAREDLQIAGETSDLLIDRPERGE